MWQNLKFVQLLPGTVWSDTEEEVESNLNQNGNGTLAWYLVWTRKLENLSENAASAKPEVEDTRYKPLTKFRLALLCHT